MSSISRQIALLELESVPVLLGLVFTAVLVAVLTAFFFPTQLFAQKKRNFLLLGPKDAGKTNMFQLLTLGELPPLTVSSIEPAAGQIKLENSHYSDYFSDIVLHDFPASPKLKNLYLYPFLKENLLHCKGTIYIVDASSFTPDYCYKVASDLLDLMQITESISNGVDMVIFCNKCDYFTSKKPLKIKQLLEQEITKQYKLKLKSLGEVRDTADNDDAADGTIEEVLNSAFHGGDFRFEMLEGNVDMVEGNLFKNNIEPVRDWLCQKAAN